MFSADIGANSGPVRKSMCKHQDWLGIAFDDTANDRNAIVISTNASRVKVPVIPTNNEAVVAQACGTCLDLSTLSGCFCLAAENAPVSPFSKVMMADVEAAAGGRGGNPTHAPQTHLFFLLPSSYLPIPES